MRPQHRNGLTLLHLVSKRDIDRKHGAGIFWSDDRDILRHHAIAAQINEIAGQQVEQQECEASQHR